jgi:hypothetical protein
LHSFGSEQKIGEKEDLIQQLMGFELGSAKIWAKEPYHYTARWDVNRIGSAFLYCTVNGVLS